MAKKSLGLLIFLILPAAALAPAFADVANVLPPCPAASTGTSVANCTPVKKASTKTLKGRGLGTGISATSIHSGFSQPVGAPIIKKKPAVKGVKAVTGTASASPARASSNAQSSGVAPIADKSKTPPPPGTACGPVKGIVNTGVDASKYLNDCIAKLNPATPTMIELPVGTYAINQPVTLKGNMSLQTQGLDATSPSCKGDEDVSGAVPCAEFKFGQAGIFIDASNGLVRLGHLKGAFLVVK